jgi:hypothetical protein
MTTSNLGLTVAMLCTETVLDTPTHLFTFIREEFLMPTFTIELSKAEAKALAVVAYDPQEWIQNAASERARIAMEEIFQTEAARMLADPKIKSIPADRESVVLSASVKTVAERQAESEANMEAGLPVDTV